MGVRFVIGRAGSGKTYRCFSRIVEAMREDPMGPAIYFIVPKQATFQAERELTCASGLGGFCRAHVVSFDELAREVLAECGGSAIPEVTGLGRQMILGHLLRKHQPQLRFFHGVARQAGLAAKLDETFGELERCGKDVADLKTLVEELEAAGPSDADSASLLNKARDLALIYEAYCAYLGQDRLDPHRRMAQLLACVRTSKALRGAAVYVDGFADFGEHERRVLSAVASVCQEMEIALLMDGSSPVLRAGHGLPHDLSAFHRTERAYVQLRHVFQEEAVQIESAVVLREGHRLSNPALAHIERHLFHNSGYGQIPAEGITLIEAPDRRAEVDAAARYIRSLLQEGFRLRQIMVQARDIGLYHEMIRASFHEHGIPYFLDRRRTVAHHPLLQFIRSALLIACRDWPQEAVMAMLKSGLAGLTLPEADELENYVLLHRIRGPAWARAADWDYHRTLVDDDEDEVPLVEQMEAQRADALRRRLVDPLRPFLRKLSASHPLTIRQIVLDLFELLERFGVRQTMAKWITDATDASRLEQAAEDQQVWTETIELLDQMVDLLGEEQVSVGDFLEILDSGLEQFDLALTPPTVDQVLVGEVDRTRSPELRAIVLLGMNEGLFPRVPREDSVLSDGERRILRQRRIDVDPDTTRRLLDENLLGYVALTRASERLCLTRSTSDDKGRVLGPSAFWRQLLLLFPDLRPQAIAREQADTADGIGTPRQLVTGLMGWVWRGGGVTPDAPWPALYQWLAGRACSSDMVDSVRYRAWRALRYANEAMLDPQIAQQLFASPLHASVTRIETFATCPFKHFLRYGLALCQREEEDVTAMDLGNVYHQILEKLVAQVLQHSGTWNDLDGPQAKALIGQYAQQVGQSLRGELMLSSARNKFLLQRIEKTLEQVVASQRAASQRGRFRPRYAELGFGGEGGRLPPYRLKTPRGREVLLHGKIDRVDMIQDQAQFAVIDYKLSGNPLSLERVYHGIALQLLTYLLVLQAHGQQLEGRKLTPVAAFYVRLLRRLDDVKHPEDAPLPEDEAFDLQVKPRGIFDGQYIHDLDKDLDTGESQVVQASIKKDGAFGYRERSDVADSGEFAALLSHVEKRLGQLADQILSGDITIGPYRIGRRTPCPQCEYRSVCRFDVVFNRYHFLPSMKRDEVLAQLAGRGA